MRNRELHDALREFALESAALLSAEVAAGAELPYDVVEEPGTGSVLYRYLPLTSNFVAARWDALRAMPAHDAAARALGTGAEAYLRLRGLPAAADSGPALRAMIDRLYEDATDFQFPEERFERVYAEVERTLYENTMRTAVVAPVHGLLMEADRLDLGGGLVLARGDSVSAPPEAVWPLGPGERERATGPNVVAALERDVETDSPLPAGEARVRFRRLLTALRLFKPGRVSVGPVAWGRADEGVWQPLPLALGGPGRGEPWVLGADEEGQMRELVELVASTRNGGRIGWALARFEMGCERTADMDALSDYLLAVQSLLDAGDDAGRASLGQRLAALCAEDHERGAVRARLDAAFALDSRAMSGGAIDFDDDGDDGDGADPPRVVVAEVEQHLRALLRDVVCGYLDPDLKSVADDILLAGSEPLDIRARDLREDPEPAPAGPDPQPQPQGELDLEPEPMPDPLADSRAPDGPGTAADPRSAAWAVASLPGPRTRRESPPPPRAEDRVEDPVAYDDNTIADRPLPRFEPAAQADPQEDETIDERGQLEPALDSGVTPSADWEMDDDAASYSAPI
ncbi:MAG: hypothetical protein QOD53_1750 [Thermoleophilaceae bacterium]|jgi:hypothetical protein|nr:hypothetical protein [Thermoleophilaceae bacterium]